MSPSTFTTEEDFYAAFDEYADGIFRHCYFRILDREHAKELTTEAFARLWTFIADGNFVDSMRLFLYRTAHELIEGEKVSGVSDVIALTDLPAGFSALRKLPAEDQPAVILHYVDGFSLSDIGSILGSGRDHASAVNKGASLLLA